MQKSVEHTIGLILRFYGRSRTMRLGRCEHILDVYRKSMIKYVKESQSESTKLLPNTPILSTLSISASGLKEAGIMFKRGLIENLKDIGFKDRTLRLPAISLDDTSESTFLNMVAYERFHISAHNAIISYIYFMSRLISNERDVCLLENEGIISNSMASDEDVAKLFLTLYKGILQDSATCIDEVYVDIIENLINHFRNPFYRWRFHLVHFIHSYFRSRWAIVSVIAASLGLGLSITQAIYAVLSFIHRNDRS